MSRTTPSLLANLTNIFIGMLLFGLKTATGLNLESIIELLKGAFLALVIFHSIMFFLQYFFNLLTALTIWFIPVVFPILLGLSIIIGLIIAIPQFIRSIYYTIKDRRQVRYDIAS